MKIMGFDEMIDEMIDDMIDEMIDEMTFPKLFLEFHLKNTFQSTNHSHYWWLLDSSVLSHTHSIP